jgi:hypothetical protein
MYRFYDTNTIKITITNVIKIEERELIESELK